MSDEKTMTVGAKQYVVPAVDDDVRKLVAEYIDKVEHALELKCAKIEIVFVAPKIGSLKLSKVVRSNNELKFFSNFDYVIEISDSYWDKLDAKEKEIVLLYCLEQILPITNDAGETKYTLKKKQIIDMPSLKDFGFDWFKPLENKIIALELTKLQEDGKSAEKIQSFKEKLENKGLSL